LPKKPVDPAPDPLVLIDLDGEAFTFPRDRDEWPTEAILTAGLVRSGVAPYTDVVKLLLGEEQWNRLQKLPFRCFREFLRLFSKAMDDGNES
jgi:hypothetical protein